jgi:two-component system heavy metal sensor histidine kinase CusS
MRSIRFRLICGTAVAMAIILAASAVTLHFSLRFSLLREFDDALLAHARAVAAMMDQDGQKLVFEFDPNRMPDFDPGRHPAFFELWDAGGAVLGRSPSLRNADMPIPAGSPMDRAFYMRLPDGRWGRAMRFSFLPRPEEPDHPPPNRKSVTVLVGREIESVQNSVERFDIRLAVVSTIATLSSALLMVWIIGRGLRPLQTLANRIDGFQEPDLAERIELSNCPMELQPVVGRLNEMLSRLQSAFAREKAFAADVAHEMRTPLAGLQMSMEVCASKPRSSEEYSRTIEKCLGILGQMRSMIDSLLMLARAESRQLAMDMQNLSVGEVLQKSWDEHSATAASRGLHVNWQLESASQIRGDQEKLRLVFRNLFENSTAYCDEGGSIQIDTRDSDGRVVLSISNTGCWLSPEEIGHVFDRFWRGDRARSQTETHCGLGLTLCKRIVEALGGSISAQITPDERFQITMQFAASSSASVPMPVDQLI